jgi:hypothetical protein
VRDALSTLPWVEKDTIGTSIKDRQARFAVKSKEAFKFEEVKKAIGAKGFTVTRVVSGP